MRIIWRKGQHHWQKDNYGWSWQITPVQLLEMMPDTDAEKVTRVTKEMLQMEKLDIAQLQQSYDQA